MIGTVEQRRPLREMARTRAGGVGTFAGALLAVGILALAGPPQARGAELEEAERLYRTGQYDECARMVEPEAAKPFGGEEWLTLKIRAELARGKLDLALASVEQARRRFPQSVPLRLLGREVYRAAGRDAEARAELEVIDRLVRFDPRRFASPEGLVAMGRYLMIRGVDAKRVLDQFFDVVVKQRPEFVEAYLAIAELGLGKEDAALAADTLAKAPEAAREDPRYHYLRALALESGDRAASAGALAEALKINPRHVDSLLLEADHRIDSERYAEADELIRKVLDVNPVEPRAWAYLAVLAHLRADAAGEAESRRQALSPWATNPEVDHIIGRELSQKYRFAEGAAAQRRALEIDADYMPARLQLCQDLLRLGEEDEGWKLADAIFAADGYNVVAYNLVTLRDHLAGFRTLEADGIILRMDPREADLYGERVLDLLRDARKTLCERYAVELTEPVVVEIFPQRKDFAVRTFGLPGADGLLGVCFGRVITANSPASQGESPANWEAVLWHEFCHVVTLSKSRNKMPRWLSEGISVFEEHRKDPAWGMALTPRFRSMLLGEELTPLSRLSSAFLAPETPMHLQFAYFESALAVEFLVDRAGLPALQGLLEDLGKGVAMHEALPARAGMTLEEMDLAFVAFAHGRAESVAPEATWEEPDLPADADSAAISAWLAGRPRSFHGLRRLGARLVEEEKWPEARDALERLRALYPEYVGPENPYVLLATVHREQSDPAAERAILAELVRRDASASPSAHLRLMELDAAAEDWAGLAADARRLLAVHPLIPAPHRQLGRAAERLGEPAEAIGAYRRLSLLDDTDPADVHYRLARLLRQAGEPEQARREVLKALEEAPRFQDAHRLLLELVEAQPREETP